MLPFGCSGTFGCSKTSGLDAARLRVAMSGGTTLFSTVEVGVATSNNSSEVFGDLFYRAILEISTLSVGGALFSSLYNLVGTSLHGLLAYSTAVFFQSSSKTVAMVSK